MRTAALILNEVPRSCDECPLCRRECIDEYLEEYEDECMFSDEDITDECYFKRPNWCPLLVEELDYNYEECDLTEEWKQLGYTDEEAKELVELSDIYI